MKKKSLFILSLIVFFTINNYAQMVVTHRLVDDFKVLDSCKFRVTYELDFVNDPDKPDIIESDLILLEVGKKISKSYSLNLYIYDSIYTDAISKGLRTAPLFQNSVPPVEVYKNYPDGKITVSYRSPFQGPVFIYTEEYPNFRWNVCTERKKILGYNCQKATTIFRGRDWVAWFTNDIPISEGPYKFAGLPGLILEVYDNQSNYTFKCIGIKETCNPIKYWNWDYNKTTREELNEFLKKVYSDPNNYLKSFGSKIVFVGEKNNASKNSFMPYNPIELK